MTEEKGRIIYLDNNATSCVAPEAYEAMVPYLTQYYGNPSSIHTFGGHIARKIEEAREKTASFLGAAPSEVIFTSCATESDSSAVWNAVTLFPKRHKIVTTAVEHPAILSLAADLEKRGFELVKIPVDAMGDPDMAFAEEVIDSDTALVTIMWANNETGNIHPIEKLAELAHKNGALFHTDAVQAAGKIPIDCSCGFIDMLSISGHKFHAPKGVGALYVRRGVRFHPFLAGGHQERLRRAGTENVASIIAMGEAARLAAENMELENTFVKGLRDRLEKELLKLPATRLNGNPAHRTPNTSNISFEFIEGESILMMLDMFGICASSGSACTTGSLEPSHVLRAMGVPYKAAHGAIRFSFSRYNTEADVDYVLEKLPPVIARLREISPYWKKREM